MDIYRMEREAKDREHEGRSLSFTITGPTGARGAKWLDPHMGVIQVDGVDGFLMTRQMGELPEELTSFEWDD